MTVRILIAVVYAQWLTSRIHKNHVGAGPKTRRNNRMEKATYES